MGMESTAWAQEEFGGAELGDKRRTERLKAMAARMAEKPGGKLTRVFESVAEREGAYRFIENSDVSIAEMERARCEACARRLEPMTIRRAAGRRRCHSTGEGPTSWDVAGAGPPGLARRPIVIETSA